MSGLIILLLSAVVAGALGLRFRHPKMKPVVAFFVGALGGTLIAVALTYLVVGSYLLMPVYAIFGSWLVHYGIKRVHKEEAN